MAAKYNYIKNYKEAKIWSDKTLLVFETNFKKGQINEDQVIPLYATSLVVRANILSELDELPMALEILEKAKINLLKVFPSNSMESANVEMEIALVRWEINQSDELAAQHLSKSLEIFANINQGLVGKHLTAHELKIVMQKKSDIDKAKKLLAEVIERLKTEKQSDDVIEKLRNKFSDLLTTDTPNENK